MIPNDAVMISPVDTSRIVPDDVPLSVNEIVPVNVPIGPSESDTEIPVASVSEVIVDKMLPKLFEDASITVMVAVSLSLYSDSSNDILIGEIVPILNNISFGGDGDVR